jgi:hypothetical protein
MRAILGLAVVLLAGPAFAQSPEVGVEGATGATSYERVTTYDFEDDYVEGQLLRPDGENIAGQRHGKESSLIRIRQDFVPEMVQSVEDL